jgi:hypothetical protein
LNASGVATFSTSSLSVGTQSITASYGGNSKDNSSVSNAVSVVVTQTAVATTTMLTASATQITIGQRVAFTAKVVPQSGKGVPTGSIKFFDGTTSLGKASLNAGGTATLSTTALAAGTHSITASYFGEGEDSGSVSNAVRVVVTQSTVATTTTLAASAAQITSGQRRSSSRTAVRFGRCLLALTFAGPITPPFLSPSAQVMPTKCFFDLLSAISAPNPNVTTASPIAAPTLR